MEDEKKCRLTDPRTAPLKDLLAEIQRLELLSAFYDTKQLALKKFINSVYGAIASKYFIAHNTAVAEAITMQGQDLNHFSENSVNRYFNGIFQSDEVLDHIIYVNDIKWSPTEQYYKYDKATKGYVLVGTVSEDAFNECDPKTKKPIRKYFKSMTFLERLGITREQAKGYVISMGKTTNTGKLDEPIFDYLDKSVCNGEESLTVAGDTDSVAEDSKIIVDGNYMTIAEFFKQCKYENYDIVLSFDGKEIVPVLNTHTTPSVDNDMNVSDSIVKYVSRHKVSKARYKIKTTDGKEVIVTADHSCMVVRDGKLISVKAKDINAETDMLVVKDN